MKRFVVATVAAALLATSVQAGSCGGGDHAQNPKEMAIKYFKQMDANGDEVITKLEFGSSPMAKMVKSFHVLKPNEKGEVKKQNFIEVFVEVHTKPNDEA